MELLPVAVTTVLVALAGPLGITLCWSPDLVGERVDFQPPADAHS